MLDVGIAPSTKLGFLVAAVVTFTIVCGRQRPSLPRERLAVLFVLFALVVAIAGCGAHYHEGDERHRSDVVPIVGFQVLPQHEQETLGGAEDVLGLELSRDAYRAGSGAVFLIVQARVGRHEGETEIVDRCSPVAWAEEDPVALAHELGHALGLEHVDDPDNLMYPIDEGGTELTEDQIDFMRWDAWYLQHRC